MLDPRYLNWLTNSKPKSGTVFDTMKSSKKLFKSALKKCRNKVNQHKADAMVDALCQDISGKKFWAKVKQNNLRPPLPLSIEGT